MTVKPSCAAFLLVAAAAVLAAGQPQMPPGFTARRIAPLLDGQTPELAAIGRPGLTGVIAATRNSNTVTFRLIRPSGQIEVIAAHPVRNQRVLRIRSDDDGEVDGLIHCTLHVLPGGPRATLYLTIAPATGTVVERFLHQDDDDVTFDFELTTGEHGLPRGAVMLDRWGLPTELGYFEVPAYAPIVADDDSLPPGRTDTDVVGMQRDRSGAYGGGVLIADTDDNHDLVSCIYELRDVVQGGAYRTISQVSVAEHQYGDLGIAGAGPLGGVVYVTDTLADEIQQVSPAGVHTTWASGFSGVDSLAISGDGASMYVADQDGIWLIREAGGQPGPTVLSHEPNDAGGSRLSGDPTTFFRIILSEPVSFSGEDLSLTNHAGQPIGFDASGSGSQFILIGLDAPLFADTYTLTIADTVTSLATGEPLDGDNDGVAGGDAVLMFTHHCPADSNGDGLIDTRDVIAFLNAWVAGCP